jgi:hypothetical protein
LSARRILAGIIVLVIAGCGYLILNPATPRTTLEVSVSGLPSGVHADVWIDGPVRYEISAGDTREVEPGDYTITIKPVADTEYRYLPADEQSRIVVGTGKKHSVTADYAVRMNASVRVAPPDGTPITSVTEDTVVLKRGSYADSLRPGQIIASGATEYVSSPFTAVVNSLVTRGDKVIAAVKHVPMGAVIPKMVIRTNTPIPAGSSVHPAAYRSGADFIETSFGAMCKLGDPKLNVRFHNFDLGFQTELRIEWGVHGVKIGTGPLRVTVPMPAVEKLTAGVRAQVAGAMTVQFTSEGGMDCTVNGLATDIIKKSMGKACKAIGELISVGALEPVCSLSLKSKVTGKADGSFNTGATVKADIAVRGEYHLGDGRPELNLAARPSVRADETWFSMADDWELSASYRTGVEKEIGLAIGGPVKGTRVAIVYTEWIPVGVDFSADLAEKELNTDGTIDHELGLKLELPLFPDLERSFNVLPVRIPLEKRKFGENDPAHPAVYGPRKLPPDVRLPLETKGLSGRPGEPLEILGADEIPESRLGWATAQSLPWRFDPCRRSGTETQNPKAIPHLTSGRWATRRDDEVSNRIPLADRSYPKQQLAAFDSVAAAEEFMDQLRKDAVNCAGKDKNMGVVKEVIRTPVAGASEAGFAARVERDLGAAGTEHAYYQAARIANTVILTAVSGQGPLTGLGTGPRPDITSLHRRFANGLCSDRRWAC